MARDLIAAAKRYQRAVENVFAIDPRTKKCFAEGSPTKDADVCDRFVELNDAGKALSQTIEQTENAEA